MSDQTLLRFIRRLNEDAEFLASAAADPQSAFAAFGLNETEQVALLSADEDALRRLTGSDVSGYAISSSSSILTLTRTGGSRPKDTPGSGNGCGTGSTHNCLRFGVLG